MSRFYFKLAVKEQCSELVISETFLLEKKFVEQRRYNKCVPIKMSRFLSRPTTSQKVLLISVKSIKKLLKISHYFSEGIINYITYIQKVLSLTKLGTIFFIPCNNVTIIKAVHSREKTKSGPLSQTMIPVKLKRE